VTQNARSTSPALAWYRFVLAGGRVLARVMRVLLRLRGYQAPLHPKHLAMTDEAHHWYAPHVKPGWLVADLGCDEGGHAIYLAKAGTKVVGLETSGEALRLAVRHDRIGYARADLETSLPLEGGKFDALVALDVIEHLNNREQFLDEARRLLKPNGILLLSAPNRETDWNRTARRLGVFELSDPDHKFEYSRQELVGAVESAGFSIHSIEPVVLDTPWAGWIDFVGGISFAGYRRLVQWKRDVVLKDPSQSTGFRIVAKPTELKD
jgi:2-polyprenyl-6-hydroxyphenyl methylase / 3-demethylubiquinone-9 3-methyltransferase